VRTYINLMITMLLGGLWHGANWTFVVWGGLHGFYLWVEKIIADIRKDKVQAIAVTPSGEVGILGPLPETFKPIKMQAIKILHFIITLLCIKIVST